MIIGNELRTWAADRNLQHRTRVAADKFALEWGQGPVHRRFTDAMAALPERSAEAVAHAVRILFADDDWVDALLEGLSEAMHRDPFFDPPFRHLSSDIHTGLVVFEDDNVSIAAGVSRVAQLAAKKNGRRGAMSIAFTGQVGVLKFVKAGGARLSFWEAPEIDADFSAAHAGHCVRAGERDIEDGEILLIDGRREGFVIEHASANLVILQATVKPGQAPLNVEYDAENHGFVGCSAADDSASRIQMISTLVRKLGGDGAFGAVLAFIDHPNFFVRWHIMRELLGIDAEAALPHLKRMAARDPHPETRRAARIVLDGFEAQTARGKAA